MQKIYLLIGLLLAGVPVLAAADGKSTLANIPPTAWVNDLRAITEKDWNYQRAAHLLERAGFGGPPEEIGKLARLTPAQAVDALVDYEQIADGKLPLFEPSGIYLYGAKLAPFSQEIMEASHKAAMELYAETTAANEKFKKVHDAYMAFRNDEYLWWQVAEYTYDNFMIRQRAKG